MTNRGPTKHGEFVAQCARSARALATVMGNSFGPLGNDQLVVDEIQGLLVCNSGRAVVSNMAVSSDDFTTRLILKALADFEARAGDGTSTVAIMLAGALTAVEERGLQNSSRSLVRLGQGLSAARMELLASGHLSNALQQEHALAGVNFLNRDHVIGMATSIAETCLNQQFNVETERELCKVVGAWIEKVFEANPGAPAAPLLYAMCKNYDSKIISLAPAYPPQLSVLSSDSILIDRPALHRVHGLDNSAALRSRTTSVAASDSLHVLALACPLVALPGEESSRRGELGDEKKNYAVRVCSPEELVDSLNYKSAQISKAIGTILEQLPRLGLLLCSHDLPGPAFALLERAGVLAVQNCSSSLLHDVEAMTGVSAVYDMKDVEASSYASFVFGARSVREVKLGGSFAVIVQGISCRQALSWDGRHAVRVPQVVLRGTSQGLVQQYRAALSRVVRLLALWAADHSCSGAILPGGCATELYLFHFFADQAEQSRLSSQAARSQVYQVLARSALAVPLALLSNADGPRQDWLSVIRHSPVRSMVSFSESGRPTLGPCPCTVQAPGQSARCIEPLALKLEQMHAFLALLEQILRIEQAILVQNK